MYKMARGTSGSNISISLITFEFTIISLFYTSSLIYKCEIFKALSLRLFMRYFSFYTIQI